MTKVIRLTAQGNGGFCGCDHCPSMANVSQFDADVEVLRQQLGDHIRQAAKQARDDGDRLCPWVAATAIMDTLVRIVASFKDSRAVMIDLAFPYLLEDLERLKQGPNRH